MATAVVNGGVKKRGRKPAQAIADSYTLSTRDDLYMLFSVCDLAQQVIMALGGLTLAEGCETPLDNAALAARRDWPTVIVSVGTMRSLFVRLGLPVNMAELDGVIYKGLRASESRADNADAIQDKCKHIVLLVMQAVSIQIFQSLK
jgi:hypothetical protein